MVGAGWYGDHPTETLASILAAINMDLIHGDRPSRHPGRDYAEQYARAERARCLDGHRRGPRSIRTMRQPNWSARMALGACPAWRADLMIGGSFSNMTLLGNFLEHGRYHSPDDQADSQLVLDGAAEDMNLTVALVRRIADPSVYQRPRPRTPAQRPAQ